jgi:glutamate/tyrosine decarboxylase-like PLP-dependent enzyme
MSVSKGAPSGRTFGQETNVLDEMAELFKPDSPFMSLLTKAANSEVQGDAHLQRTVEAIRNRFATDLTDDQGLSVDFGKDSHSLEQLIKELQVIVEATPRTTGPNFFNQLFAGLEPIGLAADLLACILNNSMFTFKCAGPQILIEKAVLARMAQKIGYNPEVAEGTFAPGGSLSNLTALTVARGEAMPGVGESGMFGRKARMYTSASSHYSVSKSAMLLGFGRDNLVKIPVNELGRLKVDLLREAIEKDIKEGYTPVAVIATSGTTVLGAFDDIPPIADICEEKGIWLHVDAAHGGTLLMSPKHRVKMEGIERSDSVTWCAHKLMGVPVLASVAIFKKKGLLTKHLNEQSATYLFQVANDDYHNMNPGRSTIQCGRRNNALKLWAAWRHLGDEGYAARVDHQVAAVERLADRVRGNSHCKLMTEPQAITLSFETPGVSPITVCDAMNDEHCIKVGHAVELGKPIIRVSIPNPDVTTEALDDFFDKMFAKIAELQPKA